MREPFPGVRVGALPAIQQLHLPWTADEATAPLSFPREHRHCACQLQGNQREQKRSLPTPCFLVRTGGGEARPEMSSPIPLSPPHVKPSPRGTGNLSQNIDHTGRVAGPDPGGRQEPGAPHSEALAGQGLGRREGLSCSVRKPSSQPRILATPISPACFSPGLAPRVSESTSHREPLALKRFESGVLVQPSLPQLQIPTTEHPPAHTAPDVRLLWMALLRNLFLHCLQLRHLRLERHHGIRET